MVYQCLKCGTTFADGTTTILRGCPDCHGTRFFYTEIPLSQAERENRLRESDQAMPSLAREVVRRATDQAPLQAPESLSLPSAFQTPMGSGEVTTDGRLLVKVPKDIQQRIRRATAGWDYEVATAPPPPAPLQASPSEPIPVVATAAPIPPPSEASEPETVKISRPGEYEIDVRRLLEKSPIVVQKDGTYLIHLPSLFEMPTKGRKE